MRTTATDIMRNRVKVLFTLLPFYLFTFLPLSASAQPEISVLQPGQAVDGTVYFLPKTTLQVHLLIEKTTYTPGEFARYAERYLRLSDIAQQEQVSHSIVRFDVSTVGVRDTSKCYLVRLKGKSKATEINLSDDGILQAVNDTPIRLTPHQTFRPARKPKITNPMQLLGREALQAGSTAKMAELTAQQIQELKEQRQLLVTGEADEMPQDESQLRLMISEIDAQCDALTSLFTGTISRDTTEQVLTICPDRELEHDVLFRLSRRLGLVDADDLSGVPFYLTLKKLNDAEGIPAPDNKKHEGFYVNVPTLARMTIEQDGQQLATFDIPFAQFGFVDLRDGGLFKGNNTHLQLHPATGAVVKMTTDAEQ
jgi:hypothetical protein